MPVKSAMRRAALLDHKARDFLVRQRIQTVNAIRAHLSEPGIVVAKGTLHLDQLLEAARDVPEAARPALDLLAGQLRGPEERLETASTGITAARAANPLARRFATTLKALHSRTISCTVPPQYLERGDRYGWWLGARRRGERADRGQHSRRADTPARTKEAGWR
ncbi:MAG: hypothetical protein NXH97_18850 [Rhodobacteraceae bacterium]|nr:hypothetical protein [Paracoccaceae bacterium]